MRKSILLSTIVLLLLAGAACGGGGDDGGDSAAPEETASNIEDSAQDAICEPAGATVNVVAVDNQFESACYAAPADAEFKLTLENQDPFAHNISIYVEKGGERLFEGPYVQGMETQTFDVGPQPAQSAYFLCDIHPQMEGTFNFA